MVATQAGTHQPSEAGLPCLRQNRQTGLGRRCCGIQVIWDLSSFLQTGRRGQAWSELYSKSILVLVAQERTPQARLPLINFNIKLLPPQFAQPKMRIRTCVDTSFCGCSPYLPSTFSQVHPIGPGGSCLLRAGA